MKGLLRFCGWATLAFVVAWFAHPPYQRALAAVAGRFAAPRGAQIEWVDLETFFPFDLSVFVALCLASAWAPWAERGRTLAIGLAVLVVLELVTLVVAMRILIGAAHDPTGMDAAQRLATGLIRALGLIAAGAVWLGLLGWERVPAFAAPAPRPERRPARRAR